MDILKYINSRDIRAHLEKMGYKFNTLEAMWLIYQCRNLDFDEKCKAWEDLMENFPDVPFTRHHIKEVKIDSSFEALRTYIKYKKESIKVFKEKRENIYYSLSIGNVEISDDYEFDTIFNTYNDVIDFIKNNPKDMLLYNRYAGNTKDEYEPDSYRIKRGIAGEYRNYTEMYLDKNLNVDNVSIENHEGDYEDKYIYCVLFEFLDNMWFNFPLPFKKGDIVVDPLYKKPGEVNCGPFVLTETCADLYKDREGSDSSDMIAYGVFVWEDGSVYDECMHSYMNLEYYRDDIKGCVRSLIPISNFLKGEIDITLCALGYHQIQLELQKNEGLNHFRVIDEEGRKLAGINDGGMK